jgi:hypothetical protein
VNRSPGTAVGPVAEAQAGGGFEPAAIAPGAIDDLVSELARRGYVVVGPTVRDGAIVIDQVDGPGMRPATMAKCTSTPRARRASLSSRTLCWAWAAAMP